MKDRVENTQNLCPGLQYAVEEARDYLSSEGFRQGGTEVYLGEEGNHAVPVGEDQVARGCLLCKDGCGAEVVVRWKLPVMGEIGVLNTETGESEKVRVYDVTSPDIEEQVWIINPDSCVLEESGGISLSD